MHTNTYPERLSLIIKIGVLYAHERVLDKIELDFSTAIPPYTGSAETPLNLFDRDSEWEIALWELAGSDHLHNYRPKHQPMLEELGLLRKYKSLMNELELSYVDDDFMPH
ncbi:hypothetical protein [Pseudomonas huaxiensis]|uniref:hypothetical protein n=1 Tax=Pseudomonas huaxiensis TaxID=2213017 RepID=UPI000DA6C3B0|nr:hypothetical protein [Pseudomonas huaxiensis]